MLSSLWLWLWLCFCHWLSLLAVVVVAVAVAAAVVADGGDAVVAFPIWTFVFSRIRDPNH